jgi:hypothetical protein
MSKKVRESALQARKGVAAVQQIVATDLRWLFREQPTDDYGIDAQMEVVEKGAATGRLIAVQIKAGPSYFQKTHPDGWWLSLDNDDLGYWLEHALPVIVILCDTTSGSAYWEVVTPDKVVTGKRGGKKILVPRSKELGSSSNAALTRVAAGQPYELRIRQLRLALPWMRLLWGGRRILLEADEWINKTSGRGDIEIVSVDDANEDRKALGGWFIMVGLRPYEDVLPALVPWADVVLHEETYSEADREAWESECVRYDREGNRFESEFFEDWLEKFDDSSLRPYGNSANEVDHWRLELVLNQLGKGFLLIDEFAEGESLVLTPNRSTGAGAADDD